MTGRNNVGLQVNRVYPGTEQVNITTQVNSAQIRREVVNGRDTWIVPSYTLPPRRDYEWRPISGQRDRRPLSRAGGHCGPAWASAGKRRVRLSLPPRRIGGVLRWGHGSERQEIRQSGLRREIHRCPECREGSEGGKRLLARLEALEEGEDVPPIHTSVAAFLERMETNEQQGRRRARSGSPKVHAMDHDAILLDEVGAATPEQGVGMMVNAYQASTNYPATPVVLPGGWNPCVSARSA